MAVMGALLGTSGYALTVTKEGVVNYDSFSTAADSTDALPAGVTYDASTGVLTGLNNKDLYFALDTDVLTSANKNKHLIYVSSVNNGATGAAWGFNTTSDGSGFVGYWNADGQGFEVAESWSTSNFVSNGTIMQSADENGVVILNASISGDGTYMYSGKNGAQLYGQSTLKTTSGSVTSVTIDKDLISYILYNVTHSATITSSDNQWVRSYDEISYNAFPTSKVDATVITSGTLTARSSYQGNSDTAENLVKNGGDIIVGGDGKLELQTWHTNDVKKGLNIDVSESDIYLGGGELSLRTYSGDITVGDITLIENSALFKEADKGNNNTLTFAGAITGNYALNIKALDDTKFNNVVNLSGITTSGATSATFGAGADVDVTTLTVTAATEFAVEDGASVTFGNIQLRNANNGAYLTVGGTVTVNETIATDTNGGGKLTINEGGHLEANQIKNSWGLTLVVDGELEIGSGGLQFVSGSTDNISGSGTIKTSMLGSGNAGTYVFDGGLRVEIGNGGIAQSTLNSHTGDKLIFRHVTIAATEQWTNEVTKNIKLGDSTNGTTFEVNDGENITIAGTLTNEDNKQGKLVKDGLGELVLKGNNSYSGGTDLSGGKLTMKGGGNLSGNINILAGGTSLTFDAADNATSETPTTYTIGGIATKKGAITSDIIIAENTKVKATSIDNGWGIKQLTVDGVLEVTDTLKFATGNNTLEEANVINGSGSISAKKLDFSNLGNYTIQDVSLTVSETSKILPDTYEKTTKIKNAVVDFGQLTFSRLVTLLMESGSMTMSSTDGDGKLDIRSGLVTLKTGSHEVANLDMSANNSSGVVQLKESAVLEVGSLKMNKDTNNTAKITLEKDAEVKLAGGVVSVKGISSTENERAEIFAQNMDANSSTEYSTGNNAYRFKNADVTVNSSTDFDLTNCLDNSSITNNGTGTVNLRFGASDRTEVHALKGSINIMWMGGANPSTESLTQLEIANGLTVGAQAGGDALAEIKNYATLSVTESVSMGTNATVAGHLTINSGASLTLGGWNETAAQVLGNLTLGTGLTLGGAALNAIESLQYGESLVLFDKVSGLVFSPEENTVMTLDISTMAGIDASTYFSNLEDGIYYISHVGQQVIITSNIPEPTTATLSLLALAALAARRRRK